MTEAKTAAETAISQYFSFEHSETAASASGELFRSVLEASPDGFMILPSVRDASGTIADFQIEYVNPVAATALNRSPEELLGQRLLDLLPDCRTNDSFDRYVAVAETGDSAVFESFYESQSATGWFRHVVVKLNGGIAVCFSDITQRKQAELALQQQEQHFRVALQTAKLGSWEHDLTTGVLTCSAQCKANFGLPPDAEFTHETLFAALHPDDRPLVQAAIRRSIEQQTDYEVEERCYHPDGSLHWLVVKGQLVYDSKGTPIRLVGVTLDITERKRSEIALRESQELFQSFMNHSPIAAFIKDEAGRYLYANPWVERVYQRSQADLIGKTDFELLPPAVAQQFHQNDLAVLSNGQSMQMLETIHHEDGEHSYMSFKFPFRNGAGKQVVAGVAIDISERIQAEETLRQSEERLRIAQQAANAGVWNWDMRLDQVTWSEEYYRLYGLDPSVTQPSYANWLSSIVEQDRDRVDQTLREVLADRIDLNVEFRILHPVRGERWLTAIGQTFYDDNGQPQRMTGIALDITERKQTEKALERYQLLSEHSRDIVLYFRSNGQILEANQAAVQAYGYDRAELLTLKIADLRAPNTLAIMPEQFEQAGKQGILFETVHCRKDGSIFPVEVSSQSAMIADEYVVLSVIRDITERKRAEAERDQLLLREQTARRAAEVAEQRAKFLAEASTTLTSSLDYEYTLSSVARAVVPTLADWCAIDILKENGQLERLATAHVDPAKVQWGLELHRRYPPDLNAAQGIAEVLRSGQSEYYPTISDDQLVGAARDAEHLKILREIGFSSVMLVPLRARNRTLGTISFIAAESGRSYSPDDLSLAEELARRAAIALDNARLYREAQQARQAAERAADRTTRLQSVTAALSESLTPVQVAEVIVEQSLAALEADAALMALLSNDGTMLEIVQTVGYDIQSADQQRFPIDSSMPLAEAMRTRQPMWSELTSERLVRYPHLAEIYKRFPFEAWISLPLVVEGKAVGGLSLSFKQFKHLNQDDRDFVLALSRQCAQAIVRSQLYEAEQRARAEAERANRIKDEFLAVLSHELRSPLNPILGWARLLQTRQFDQAETNRALETIERNAKLQTQLIDDLLDVSRILRGKMLLNISLVDPVNVIDAGLETVRLSSEAKNIQIRKVVTGEIGMILGDAGRLQQIVWNLLSNAIKFTPAGGRVEVRLERVGGDRKNEVDMAGEADRQSSTFLPSPPSLPDQYAQITVTDTGKGIAPEFLPYVFDCFRQEDGTITRKFGGLGLGLAIVRYLTELHGGTVQAESSGEGQGSTFTVRLPLQGSGTEWNSEADHAVISPPSHRPLAELRVLVVDDEADMRELMVAILEQAGAETKVTTSAIEALDALAGFKPDVLISDIGMPEMDGYELLRQIRSRPPEQGGAIPAITLTAYAGEVNQQQALTAGFQTHIAKPVEPEALVKAILNLVKPD